jgi:hypothetical protein
MNGDVSRWNGEVAEHNTHAFFAFLLGGRIGASIWHNDATPRLMLFGG